MESGVRLGVLSGYDCQLTYLKKLQNFVARSSEHNQLPNRGAAPRTEDHIGLVHRSKTLEMKAPYGKSQPD